MRCEVYGEKVKLISVRICLSPTEVVLRLETRVGERVLIGRPFIPNQWGVRCAVNLPAAAFIRESPRAN